MNVTWLEKHRNLIVTFGLAALTFLLFLPALGFDFIRYDDFEYVKENFHVRTGVTIDNIIWAFGHAYSSNWHPLTWISHMIDAELFGLNPGGHHAVNVIFHSFNTVLLFIVLRKMTGRFWQSAVVAALFGWHPLHVQSVAWVSERKDVLSAFFALWTLFFYARYVEKLNRPAGVSQGRAKLDYALSLFFFALGLMSKPMLVTLPLLLLLLDFWPLARIAPIHVTAPQSKGRFLLAEKIPFFALTVLSVLITLWAQRGAIRSLEQISMALRLENAPVAVLGYIGKMFLPIDLAVLYPFPTELSFFDVGVAILLLTLITVASFRYAHRFPFLPVGWFWFLIGLIPVIGVVQVGTQSMADRYTYLPIIGLFVILAWIVPTFVRGRALIYLSVAALALSWIGARYQVQFWKDDFRIFQRAAEVTDDNIIAYDHVAENLVASGQPDVALTMYREAVRLNPRDADMHNNLGQWLARDGKFTEAIPEFNEAIRLNEKCARAYSNLGAVRATRGEFDEGIRNLLTALRLAPDDAEVHVNLANVLLGHGQAAEALPHLRDAIRFQPEDSSMRYLVAKSASAEFPELAIEQFHEVIKRRPDWLVPLNELA
ncbi:MAG: hypothetical protein JWM68_3975, partial [Verrucomicrobiales bacterium]|nr:hypothetical protein [Verrucomicrobiales bacterium]